MEMTTVALSFAEKEAIVAEVAEVAKRSYSVIAAEYRGLTVEQLTALRVEARKAGVYVRVVKNTLARRAFADTEFACMHDGLKGPLILAFSQADPGAGARVVEAFAKGKDKFQVKVVAFAGRLFDPTDLSTLAKMPTREEALAQLLAVMKAPVQKLASTIREVPAKLLRTIAAIREAKEAA